MKVLSCTAARRRLEAYHDDELAVGQRIEVDAHLEWCDDCANALEDLQMVHSVVRGLAPGRVPLTTEERVGFQASVVNRAGAEQTMALPVRVRAMFEDMHFVYAGLGAVGATVSCITIMLSMMNFAALTSPGFNQNPVVVDARMLMPLPSRVLEQGVEVAATATDGANEDDAAFTLSGVVTREGRLMNLEYHTEDGQKPAAGSIQARAVQSMLGAMSQTRFEPARVAGLPIAVNMFWLVTHTTVRGAKIPITDLPVVQIPKKRRVDDLNVAPASGKTLVATVGHSAISAV